jgi:hypothetical protein
MTLNFRDSYFTARNHDGKAWNWDGNVITPAHHPTQPLIGSSESATFIPMNQRRPSTPTRISRVIVNAFTGMLFGDKRFPSITSSDPDTQDFAREIVRITKLESQMIRARKIGGSNGTVVLSWWFDSGRPRVRVHTPRFVHVMQWADPDDLEVGHAIEVYKFTRLELNSKSKRVEPVEYWQRRDWTTVADVVFVPKRCIEENPTPWVIDEDRSVRHNSGFAHIVWIQNMPDEDTFSVDGQTDYAELYEQMDEHDVMNSAYISGVKQNVDPTLVLGLDKQELGDAEVRKGSKHALAVGQGGTASYLTLPSDMVTSGSTAVKDIRSQILEAAECVIPDPDKIAAAGTSGFALKMIYAPMLSKVDVLRQQYGDGIQRLVNQMVITAREHVRDPSANTIEQQFVHEPVIDESGNEVVDPDTGDVQLEPVDYRLELRPRIVKTETLDEDGNPTGEFSMIEEPRHPGNGEIEVEWPEYFRQTDTDRQAKVSAITMAVAGKVLSQKTAVEKMSLDYDVDPAEEYARVREEQAQAAAAAAAAQSGMFPSIGGVVPDDVPTEPITTDAPSEEVEAVTAPADDPGVVETPAGIPVELAPTTISKLITANEARKLLGQGPALLPDGSLDPAGNLPIDSYAEVLTLRNQPPPSPQTPPTPTE